jgi:hypothetical protein
VKRADSVYALGNLRKKYLWIADIPRAGPLSDQSADDLQAVGDPVVRLLLHSVAEIWD